MDLTKYTTDQLRIILREVIWKQCDQWNHSKDIITLDIPETKKKLVCTRLWDDELKNSKGVLVNLPTYRIRSRVVRKLHQEQFIPILNASITNVKDDYTNKGAIENIFNEAYRINPTQVELLVKNFDVVKFVEKRDRQRILSREYLKKRQSETFSFREQKYITDGVMNFIRSKFRTTILDSILTDQSNIVMRFNLATNGVTQNYFWQLYQYSLSKDISNLDLSGERLLESILSTFKIDKDELLKEFSNSTNTSLRRFAVVFGQKYTIGGLVDNNEKVRLTAKALVKKRRESQNGST